jgi:hypothetical protein
MARELIVFISSAVEGLRPVRDEIAEVLRGRGLTVRKSDDPGFPVPIATTSHEACLRALEGVHVCIVLISTRFGGEFADGKSITWMEYEAARAVGAYPIVLIEKAMHDLSVDIFKRRRALTKTYPLESETQIDARLRSRQFRDWRSVVHNLPAQQRFIDAVRKGHTDNWVHNDWTGTTADALKWIDARMATLLASTIDRYTELNARTAALLRLNDLVMLLLPETLAGRRTTADAIDHVLQVVESLRTQLFGFTENDRYNISLFVRDDADVYHSKARRAHSAIVRNERGWPLGEGQVGIAATMDEPLVTSDLTSSITRTVDPTHLAADAINYRSVVSVPLLARDGKAELVFIVSTGRKDHFHGPRQPEVLTAITVGHIFGTLWLVGGHVENAH